MAAWTWFKQRQSHLQQSCRRTFDGKRLSALPAQVTPLRVVLSRKALAMTGAASAATVSFLCQHGPAATRGVLRAWTRRIVTWLRAIWPFVRRCLPHVCSGLYKGLQREPSIRQCVLSWLLKLASRIFYINAQRATSSRSSEHQ